MMSKNRPPVAVDYLFMDSNSIIYDSVYLLQAKNEATTDESVIEQVLFRLWELIQYISPKKVLYLAFDGVAPLSKMQQQKSRRLKTAIGAKPGWSTSCISPGTEFMKKLSQSVRQEFTFKEREIGVEQILISTSEECGEGEHKLFAWLRRQQRESANLLVYGMDADLIMLTLLHIPYIQQAMVFREPPIQNKNKNENKENSLLFSFVDIVQMGAAIRQEMHLSSTSAIREYIFLCFFLGNDFLPHFPSMNIRTHGIPTLLEIYKKLGQGNVFIHPTSGHIQWPTVRKFIEICAKYEHEWLMQEYKVRDKMQAQLTLDPKNLENILENAPILLRGVERYIRPQTLGWQSRYYESLFPPETQPRTVCLNFLEGLQWVYLYYTEGCTDWRWQYDYSYPPLWTDLSKHFTIPPRCKEREPFTSAEQLAYIMPPKNVQQLELKYQWSFCRYLWEAKLG